MMGHTSVVSRRCQMIRTTGGIRNDQKRGQQSKFSVEIPDAMLLRMSILQLRKLDCRTGRTHHRQPTDRDELGTSPVIL